MLITRTPMRISFAGGGTDIDEYSHKDYGAVCSMAIDKYVYITVKDLPEGFPYNYKLAYSETELCQYPSHIKHKYLAEALKDYSGRLDLSCMSDIPAGTGMGSSSSFTVGLLNALSLIKGTMLSKEELAQAACSFEIDKLGEPIGRQDQYSAAYGGLNYFRFQKTGVDVYPVVLSPERVDYFMRHLRLYSIGTQDRRAGAILKAQSKTSNNLDEMRSLASSCVSAFTCGDARALGELLHIGWLYKRELGPGITNPEIDSLLERAQANGAYGGKLLGAGGCGFLLICARPELDLDLGLREVPFKPDWQGSRSYYIED